MMIFANIHRHAVIPSAVAAVSLLQLFSDNRFRKFAARKANALENVKESDGYIQYPYGPAGMPASEQKRWQEKMR